MSEHTDQLATFFRQAKQGASLGLADEAQDLAGSGLGYAALRAMYAAGLTKVKPEFVKILRNARAESQSEISKDWKDHPVLSVAGQITGSVPFMLGQAGTKAITSLPKIVSSLPGASKAASFAGNAAEKLANFNTGLQGWAATGGRLARAGKGAEIGAGYGLGSGFGSAGDSFDDRLRGSTTGTALGTVLGGVGGAVSRGQPTLSSVAPQVAKQVGQNPAEKEFLRQLAMRPELKTMLDRAEQLQTASQKTGINLTLPEMIAQTDIDPLLARQSLLMKNPATAGAAQSIIEQRMGNMNNPGQVQRAIDSVSQSLSPGSYDELAQGLIGSADDASKNITSKLSEKASPLYKEAFQANKSVQSPVIDRILETPAGKQALARTRTLMQNQMAKMGVPDKELAEIAKELGVKSKGGVASGLKLETLDNIKKGFDALISDELSKSAPGTTSATARSLMDLKGALVNEMDKLDVTGIAGPNSLKPEGGAYSRARGVYSGQPDQLLMREQIGNLANVDPLKPQNVVNNLYSGTPGTAQRASEAFGPQNSKAAAAAYLQDMLGGLKSGNLPPKMDADTLKMLQTYAGEAGGDLQSTLDVVERARMGNRYLYGSQTAPLQQAQSGMAQEAGGALMDAATGNKLGLLKKAGKAVGGAIGRQNEEQYAKDLLSTFYSPRGMELLRDATSTQQKLLSAPASANVSIPTMRAATAPMGAVASPRDYLPAANVPALVSGSGANALPPGFTRDRDKENENPGMIIDITHGNKELPQGFTRDR